MKYAKMLMASAVICTGNLFAQEMEQDEIEHLEEVVVIDSKFNLSRENSGKVVAKITTEDLRKSKGQTLPQVLNRISGIEIGGSRGNDGQNLGYYVRGGRNRQVVILVDGIQVNDPSSIANDFDLRLLPLSQVASVEIIKGAASTLYGSGAGTAVINIQTKKPVEKNIGLELQSSVGTNQSQEDQDYNLAEYENLLSVGGRGKGLNYHASFSHRYSDNLSAMSTDGENDFSEDPFTKYNLNARVGYAVNEDFDFHFFGSFDDFTSNYDNYDFTDGNNKLYSNQLRLGSKWEYRYNKGSLVFNNSYNQLDREVEADFPNKFDSRLMVFDAYNKYDFSRNFHALIGLNGQFSNFSTYEIPYDGNNFEQVISEEDAHFQIVDPYLNAVYISDFGLNINAGTRLNIHSNYGNHWVFNVNPSYNLDFSDFDLKVLTSYSTAYTTPSLYQLYDAAYGNSDLNPEESRTMEAGVELNSTAFRASVVYFNRKEKEYIDFILIDPTNFLYSYRNIDEEFTADGVEVEVLTQFTNQLSFSGNYTFTQAAERFALRIPKHKVNAGLSFVPNEKSTVSLNYQYNDNRTDSFYNEVSMANEVISLDSFGLLDLFASHRFSEQLEVFGGISNITNESYRELYGYSTRGRNVRLGFSLWL